MVLMVPRSHTSSDLSSWPGSSQKHLQHESRAALPVATKETALQPGLRPLWGTSKGSFIWFPHIVSLLPSVSTRFLVPLNRQPSSACHADYASTDLGRWRQAGNESTNANKWGKKTVRMCEIWTNRHSDSWNTVISQINSERGTMALYCLYALKCWHSLNALITWNARISNSVSGSAEQLALQPVGKPERKEQLN